MEEKTYQEQESEFDDPKIHMIELWTICHKISIHKVIKE